MTYDEFLADLEFAKITGAIYKFKNKINGFKKDNYIYMLEEDYIKRM